MKDYTLYQAPVFFRAEDFIHTLQADWTERQLALHRTTVGGFLLLEEAFRLHQEAIGDRDWDAVQKTLEQLHTYVFTVFATASDRMQEAAKVSTKTRKGGNASAAARKKHNREEVRIRFTNRIEQYSNDRGKAVRKLADELRLQHNSTTKLLRRYGLGCPKTAFLDTLDQDSTPLTAM